MLLDATGMQKVSNLTVLREFIFRIIVLFPEIDFKSNVNKNYFLFECWDKNGNTFLYRIHHLAQIINSESFRNQMNKETFLIEAGDLRSIANSVQMFSGFSLIDKNGNKIMLNGSACNTSPENLIEAYNTAAEIINFGQSNSFTGFHIFFPDNS